MGEGKQAKSPTCKPKSGVYNAPKQKSALIKQGNSGEKVKSVGWKTG